MSLPKSISKLCRLTLYKNIQVSLNAIACLKTSILAVVSTLSNLSSRVLGEQCQQKAGKGLIFIFGCTENFN